jgi:hypothetical protein
VVLAPGGLPKIGTGCPAQKAEQIEEGMVQQFGFKCRAKLLLQSLLISIILRFGATHPQDILPR